MIARYLSCLAAASFAVALAACGGDGSNTSTTSTSGSTTSASSTGGTGGSGGDTTTTTSTGTGGGACARLPGPADGPRKVVVSHPFDAQGTHSDQWEVLDLDASGNLSRPGVTLTMGYAFMGEVVFTPDGKVAIAVQDDGTLGVLRFEADGKATVVHAAFQGSFYAGAVLMDRDGQGATVVDPNWRNNGGGLYRVAIGCDGTLTDLGLAAPSKLGDQIRRLGASPDLALFAAADVLDSKAGDDAFLLDVTSATPSLVAGAPAFPDADVHVSSMALTHDDAFALLADNGLGVGNRVAVVSVSKTALGALQVLSPITDPVAILTSPFDNSAIVASGEGNAVYTLGFDAGKPTAPYTVTGHVTYVGAKPQLPGAAILMERGTLKGRFYMAELSGVRTMRFEPGGTVTDLGLFDLGSGNENTVGVIGVQP